MCWCCCYYCRYYIFTIVITSAIVVIVVNAIDIIVVNEFVFIVAKEIYARFVYVQSVAAFAADSIAAATAGVVYVVVVSKLRTMFLLLFFTDASCVGER